MKSLAALFQKKPVASAIDPAPSTSASISPDTSRGSGRSNDVQPAVAPPKKRLGALAGLADKLSFLRRDRSVGRHGTGTANLRQLEQHIRQHPELKPARLDRHRAQLGLDEATGTGRLTAGSLARLPPKLASDLEAMGHVEVLGSRTIDAVWDALETNTELFEGQFDAVGNAPHSSTDNGPIVRHTQPIDLGDARRLIAASTPVATDIAAFHQTLVQDNVGLVVDLTRSAERQPNAAYAPGRNGSILRSQHGDLTVSCESRHKPKLPKATEHQLTIRSDEATAAVARLHFKGWPADGAIDGQTLVALADTIESMNPDGARATMIHGPDGSGRTDTLLAFMAARKRIADEAGGSGGSCSAAQIVSTLMDVVARGRIDRGPSFLAHRDDFALLATTLVRQFAPAIRQSRRAAMAALPRTARPGRRNPVAAAPDPSAAAAVQAEPVVQPDPTMQPDPVMQPPAAAQPVAAARQAQATQQDAGPAAAGPAPAIATLPPKPAESMWDRLAARLHGTSPGPSVPADQVGRNVEGIDCPMRTALQVRVVSQGQSSHVYLHANAITFTSDPGTRTAPADGSASTAAAAAGQSPLEFALCERFLLHGLDSGQGLYQFVSTSAHHNRIKTVESRISAQLKHQFDAAAGTPAGLVLGDRYRVSGMTEISGDEADFRRFRVDVSEVGDPARKRSMLLTQAGLKFQKKVLLADEIARASELMDSHRDDSAGTGSAQGKEPLVVSFAGVGRSATLIAYREAIRRLPDIDHEAGVDAMLEQIVMDGRHDRGPKFVQSSAQLEQLRIAVLKQFAMQGTA